MTAPSSDDLAAAYAEACLAELRALKPGNVHVYADGHRMVVADFERSAAASAPAIAHRGAAVGARIRAAVEATNAAVGQNTNLGIVLLCAPLAAAAERADDLRTAVQAVVDGLDRADAADVFAAIRLASPGGLGRVERFDVHEAPTVDLKAAMAAAAGRDRIARAYVTGFADLFEVGLPALAGASGLEPPWAATAVYLAYLARFPDTHIARKHGPDVAEQVRVEAAALATSVSVGPAATEPLLAFDRRLKENGLNPGTSADFTVATLFAGALLARKAAAAACS
jgi:triphosphoribosyl-dephospho-CoA synthase